VKIGHDTVTFMWNISDKELTLTDISLPSSGLKVRDRRKRQSYNPLGYTPLSKVSLKNLVVTYRVSILQTFYGARVFITTIRDLKRKFGIMQMNPVLGQSNPVHLSMSYVFNICFNIIIPCTP
jgi:hypothetical protein